MNSEFRYNQVLLIEDTEIDSYIATYLLEKYCVARQIIIEKSGNDALNFLTEIISSGNKFPEVIIMDMRLPDMTVTELLERMGLFPAEHLLHTKIIAISAIADKFEIDLIKNNKLVQQFIPKPLSVHSIEWI